MRTIRLEIPGIPVAQPRQRHASRHGKDGAKFSKNYTPTKHPVNAYKATVRMVAEAVGLTPQDGPVELAVTFLMPRPKSMCWKTRPTPRVPHTSRPDAENVLKAAQDALTGIAWRDDAQVYRVTMEKLVCSGDEAPGTVLTIIYHEAQEAAA